MTTMALARDLKYLRTKMRKVGITFLIFQIQKHCKLIWLLTSLIRTKNYSLSWA